MPVFYEHINDHAKIAIWHIAEEKNFFLAKVPLQREITHPHKQLQHLAGRYLLQYLYPDFPYHLIEIADTRKPYLPNEEYHFSISHCGEYAAVIVSKDRRVGIDIELVTTKVERVKHKFLNDEERGALVNGESSMVNGEWMPPSYGGEMLLTHYESGNDKSTNQLINQLTLLWCCKEAVFKWYGNGEVDFRDHIHLKIAGMNSAEGIIDCNFLKEDPQQLQIRHTNLNGLCLAWIVT